MLCISRTYHFRSPNSRSDDLDGSRNLHWDSFDNQQKYLEIGKKFKVLSLLEACFDLILSPSPSMKIKIMGRKIIENLKFEFPLRKVKIFLFSLCSFSDFP